MLQSLDRLFEYHANSGRKTERQCTKCKLPQRKEKKIILELFLHKTNGIWLHFGKGKISCWNSGEEESRKKWLRTRFTKFCSHYRHCVTHRMGPGFQKIIKNHGKNRNPKKSNKMCPE